jgi:hypothetical protein
MKFGGTHTVLEFYGVLVIATFLFLFSLTVVTYQDFSHMRLSPIRYQTHKSGGF